MISKKKLSMLRKDVLAGVSVIEALDSANVEYDDLTSSDLKELELIQSDLRTVKSINDHVNLGMKLNDATKKAGISVSAYYMRSKKYKIPRPIPSNRKARRVTSRAARLLIVEAINADRKLGMSVNDACIKNSTTWNTYKRWCKLLRIDSTKFNLSHGSRGPRKQRLKIDQSPIVKISVGDLAPGESVDIPISLDEKTGRIRPISVDEHMGPIAPERSLDPQMTKVSNAYFEQAMQEPPNWGFKRIEALGNTKAALAVIDEVKQGRHRLSVALIRHGLTKEQFTEALKILDRPMPVFKEPAQAAKKASAWYKMALGELMNKQDIIRILFLTQLVATGYLFMLFWDEGAISVSMGGLLFSVFMLGVGLPWVFFRGWDDMSVPLSKSQQKRIGFLTEAE